MSQKGYLLCYTHFSESILFEIYFLLKINVIAILVLYVYKYKNRCFVCKKKLKSENSGNISLFGVHMFGKAIFSIDSSSIGIKLSIVPIKWNASRTYDICNRVFSTGSNEFFFRTYFNQWHLKQRESRQKLFLAKKIILYFNKIFSFKNHWNQIKMFK